MSIWGELHEGKASADIITVNKDHDLSTGVVHADVLSGIVTPFVSVYSFIKGVALSNN